MPGNITAGGNGFLDNVDPMFQNEANRNFRLRLLSPCINAGDDDNLVPDFTDIDEDGNTTVEKVPLEFFIIAADLLDKNDSTREVDHGGEPQPQPLVGIDAGNMVGRICDIGAFEYRIYPR